MSCPSHKRAYVSREQSEEALIQHHIHFHHGENNGPTNVYQCDHCGGWHFTSKAPLAAILQEEETQKRIKKERIAADWERKLR
ncbi:hypothetical protein FNH22_28220 [Fulvivirga sp. M361]|uniref:hypothetical protein n=1 Tax=Fulvivirga sp. M361 TaxID=2594266 RepID=UPI001179EC23|nr:hypothetical protein [Fulvivirga sp. M361]TRX48925.1 hypothetical protein FNH22_28220 [Fulvivirga sp. M361]